MNRTTSDSGFVDSGGSEVTFLRKVARILQIVGLFVVFGCTGLDCFKCPASTPPADMGIYLGHSTAYANPRTTRGHTFTIPLRVRALNAAEVGTVTTVTPTAITGVSFYPPTTEVTLKPLGEDSLISVEATVDSTAAWGTPALRFTRTGPVAEASKLTTSTLLQIIENLVDITMPTAMDIAPGQTKSFVVSMLPVGDTEGPIQYDVAFGHAVFTHTPSTFTPTFVRGATTPTTQTISITALSTASVGTSYSLILKQAGSQVAVLLFTVVATSTDPSFTITAVPAEVSAYNMVFSENVVFTLRAVNGFSGPVDVTWTAAGEVSPSPNDETNRYTVSPGVSPTFTRRFYRYSENTEDVSVTYTGKNVGATITKSVTVVVHFPY